MGCKHNFECKNIKDIDIFGKEAELYYKGKENKTTWIGFVFTILYAAIYIAFFIYKINRMLKKTDVIFYDTFAYTEEPPSIKITNENFYGGFALEDPETYDTIVDETIYFPKAYFKVAVRNDTNWEWTVKEVELERCKLEKFGKKYQEKFKKKSMKDFYCFKEMDETLEGNFSYDLYSLFFISFFPCVNDTEKNNNHCKPIEQIDHFLSGTFISFIMEDIELTPENYSYPTRPKDIDIYYTVGKKLFQELHIYFQIINIETDLDIIGFDEFPNIKKEKFIKYDNTMQMTNLLESNIYETGESFCDVTIKLSEKILTQKRTYSKLIAVFSDVGGLTEVFLALFRIISSFSTKILYEASLVNNLFEFDVKNRKILIHNRYKNKLRKTRTREFNTKKFSHENPYPINPNNPIIIYDEVNLQTKNRLDDEIISKNKNNEIIINSRRGRGRLESNNLIISSGYKIEENNKINTSRRRIRKSSRLNSYKKTNLKEEDYLNIFMNTNKEENQINNTGDEINKNGIIKKVKFNKFFIYFCFLCVRSKKNIKNILLNEGMIIIKDNLDIINIFKRLYLDKLRNRNFKKEEEIINMSNFCKKDLITICNKNILKFTT